MKKRIFGILTAMVLCLTLLPTAALCGHTVAGWASTACLICFIGGIQSMFLGVIGEYIGKIYMEVKARPRYIISDRTGGEDSHA